MEEFQPDEKLVKCEACKKRGHTKADCWAKEYGLGKSEGKRKCFKCGDDDHIVRDCPEKVKDTSNLVKKTHTKKQEKKETGDQESFSNYLRTKDCRWCDKAYNSAFSCSGCGKQWAAKAKAEHCLAHCVKYSAASAKERGDMVIKGQNCLI